MKKTTAKKKAAKKAAIKRIAKTKRVVATPTPQPVAAAERQMSDAMRLWVSKNRNVQTQIAGVAKCSPQFVNMVIKGTRRHEKVERLLREAGAPVNG